MKINEIYTAYVSWNKGCKRRPVLVLKDDDVSVTVFKITSKYETNSPSIQRYFYPIKEWQESGLVKQSYIDTITRLNLMRKDVRFNYAGRLSVRDRNGLAEFIRNNDIN